MKRARRRARRFGRGSDALNKRKSQPEPDTNAAVLARIEAYLSAAAMSATRFGALVGDVNLVFELRLGARDLKASTIDRIDRLIAQHPKED